MRLLIHICCAPCSIYPIRVLREKNYDLQGYFFNPNIQPYQEYSRRLAALQYYAAQIHLPLLVAPGYEIEYFLRQVVYREKNRCRFCYGLRLEQAARTAKAVGATAYTTTLLFSRYQQHDLIRELGFQIGLDIGIAFYYDDFRSGWREGIDTSKKLGLYRQQYCGCIYSEKDRYYRENLPSEGVPPAKGVDAL